MSLKETRPIPFRSRARRRSAEGCAIKKPKLWGGKRKNLQSWETIGTEEEFLLFEKRSDPLPVAASPFREKSNED